MPTTINCSIIKSVQSRRTQYSAKAVQKVLTNLGWTHEIIPPATMIIQFRKTFPTKQDAINGHRELDHHLRLIHRNIAYRLDSITGSE